MKARNRPIYHCLCCGRVIITDPAALAPFCCGREMFRAAENTYIADEDVAAQDVEHSARLDRPWDRERTRVDSGAPEYISSCNDPLR